MSAVETYFAIISTPKKFRECSMAALVAVCGVNVDAYSPSNAIDLFILFNFSEKPNF
jgi:hypothetical protein